MPRRQQLGARHFEPEQLEPKGGGNFLSERLASSAAEGRVRYLQQRLYRSTANYARPQASGNCTSTEVAHTRPEAGMCDCGTRWSARVAGPCTKGAKMPPVREHDASLTRQQQAPHREARLTPKWKRTAPNRQGGKLFCQPVAAQHLYTRKLPAACTQCYLCGENTQMSSPRRLMSIIRSFNSEAGRCLREGASRSLSDPALGTSTVSHLPNVEAAFATTKRSERIKDTITVCTMVTNLKGMPQCIHPSATGQCHFATGILVASALLQHRLSQVECLIGVL